MSPVLVDPAISRQKLSRDLAHWLGDKSRRDRGWLLLDQDLERLEVELAFLAQVTISSGSAPLPIVACAIRLNYANYDLWPPSLTFIDAFSREPAKPHVRAFIPLPEGARNVLIDVHPETGQPFLCVQGIREYHSHPQHTGDDWLLYREQKHGSLSVISDRIWQFMVRNIVGLKAEMIGLPGWPLRAQVNFNIVQGQLEGLTVPVPEPVMPPAA